MRKPLLCRLGWHTSLYRDCAAFTSADRCNRCDEWVDPVEGSRVDTDRARFEPPTTFSPCPFCDVEVRGLAFVDAAGFCWHKECYDEEASIGTFNSQEES